MSKASVRSVTYAWRTMNSGSITVTSPNRRSTAVSGTATCAPIWAKAWSSANAARSPAALAASICTAAVSRTRSLV